MRNDVAFAGVSKRARAARRYLPGVLALTAGALVSAAMFALARNWDHERARSLLREDAQVQADAIRGALELSVLELEAVAAFYHASCGVSRAQFRDFVRHALARRRGVQALEWIPRVPDGQREEMEAAARNDGLAGFQITDRLTQGCMVRSPQREEYYPVCFVEPLKNNETAVGFDLGSDPARLAALQRARDTGQTLATERIVLVQEQADQYGFLIVCPVYVPGAPLNSPQERRQNLRGFALGVFRTGDVVEAALSRIRSKGVDIHVYEESDGLEKRCLACYSSAAGKVRSCPLAEESTLRSGLHVATAIDVAGRQWSLMHTPTAEYLAAIKGLRPWRVLAIGLLFTLSVTAYSLASTVRHVRVQRLAGELGEANERLRRENEIRVQAEADLRGREQELRTIFENAPALLVHLDRHGNMIEVNRWLEEVTGLAPEEVIGHHFAELGLIPADELPKMAELFAQTIAGRLPDRSIELSIARKDGRETEIEANCSPVYKDGAVTGVLVVVHDISERKQAEDALRQSEQRYRRITAAVTDYIYAVTVRDDLPVHTVHGPGCVAVTGYSAEEFAANPFLWIQMVHELDRPAVRDHAARVLVDHDAPQLEHRIIRKDGELRWVRSTIVPHCDEHGTLVSYDGLIKDVTEYRRLGEELRFAQKMEAIGVLAGGVAHDFNNLLMGISGFTQLAQEHLPADGDAREELKEVLHLADRAALLNRQLLAFSRKQALEPVVLNLNGLIEDGTRMLRRLIGEDIDLSLTLAADLDNVKADPGQMEQVLVNLVVNARDAMPKGGKLNIQTANVGACPGSQDCDAEVGLGSCVMFAVRDTGCGMDEATRAQIFEPFFTTKELGKGTGLGLATVYGIVKQHGGCIAVQSKPGEGATFRVYLPRVAQSAEPILQRPKSGAPPPRGCETVLLAEDDEKVRLLIQTFLGKLGYEILTAASCAQAENLFAQHGDGIALLLTDVVMPGGNGPELYDRLVRENPHLKVLYMSGYADQAIIARGIIAPRAAFLRKPFALEDLARQVRRVLDEGRSPEPTAPTASPPASASTQ